MCIYLHTASKWWSKLNKRNIAVNIDFVWKCVANEYALISIISYPQIDSRKIYLIARSDNEF